MDELRPDLAIRNAHQAIYNAEQSNHWNREENLEDALIALRELVGLL